MNSAKILKILALGAVAAFSMNLASCGTSSSNVAGGAGGATGTRLSMAAQVQTEFADAVPQEASGSYGGAARKEPSFGSVTQTSSDTGTVTVDQITVGISGHPDPMAWSSSGTLQIAVTHVTDDITLTSGGDQAYYSDAATDSMGETVDTEWYTFHFMEGEAASGGNTVYVAVAASYYRASASAEFDATDWMAGGVWIEDGGSGAVTIGAFADGGNLYSGTDLFEILATEITATYMASEKVFGVYSDGAGNNIPFTAAVSLEADFETEEIEGHIVDFMTEGGSSLDLTVDLETAFIEAGGDADEYTIFKGPTSAVFGGEAYDGQWGGQFHGQPDDVTADAPPRAAGTFGVATGVDSTDKSFIGTWAADLTDQDGP